MPITTKVYKNNGNEPVNIIGVGELQSGEQVSITTEYHQPVVMANYPDVVELTADDYIAEQAVNNEQSLDEASDPGAPQEADNE